ncbi:hypothetical protein Sliba_55160 [Streptomyces nigrescens]|uniref:DUF6801 domain-containing protein n=3 Tax=Streptomyces nigrescens TaxID=1920 RepID=A0A640TMB9_STRNI|nr:hypothetical protein Sliba_55160 [Streptomyces libani subsp. libani]GGW04904.1 hypothetical protein GCM10010500_67880 [Streptomyces libani subsp. libani]
MRTGKRNQNLSERRGTARGAGSVARGAMGLATAVGVAGGMLGVFGAGTAAAAPTSLTLRYRCAFPYVGAQPVTMKIDSDIPKSAVVGRPTPKFRIDAVVPVSSDRTKVIRLAGVRSIEGTADAKALVTAPQGDLDVSLPFDVSRTNVPESGSFHVKATGAAPARTFTRPGSAKITIGDLTLRLALKDARGNPTGPGEVDAPCTLDAGQNNVVASFGITGAKTPSGSVTSGATGTAGAGAPGAQTSGSTGSTGSTTDGTTRSTTSGPSGTRAGSPSGDRAADPAKTPSGGAKGGATTDGSTTDGSTGAFTSTGATSRPDTEDLVLLAVGTLVVGTVAVAAVFRFRSRGR